MRSISTIHSTYGTNLRKILGMKPRLASGECVSHENDEPERVGTGVNAHSFKLAWGKT